MHVGVNARAFSATDPGGDVQCGIRLAQALEQRDDIRITLFGHEDTESKFNGAEVVSTLFPRNSQIYGLGWEQTVLPKVAEKRDIDVLLCPNRNGPVMSVSVPVLTGVQDIFAYNRREPGLYRTLQRLRLPRMIRYSDHLTTGSRFSKHQIMSEFGLPSKDISVTYNGISETYLDDVPSEEIPVPEEYILFVGAMNKRKNFGGLLRAFEILCDQFAIDHDLVITGPRSKLIYEKVDERLSEERIHHYGFVDELELKYIYENAAVFVFPSWREGFGVPPLEAMACGTPVVASNRPCIPEVLGDAANFVDPDNPRSIAETTYETINNEVDRQTMIEKGRKRANEYRWERVADRTVEVLRSIVK